MLEPACKIQAFVRKDEQQKRGGKLLGYDLLKAAILKEFVQQGASERPSPGCRARIGRASWSAGIWFGWATSWPRKC